MGLYKKVFDKEGPVEVALFVIAMSAFFILFVVLVIHWTQKPGTEWYGITQGLIDPIFYLATLFYRPEIYIPAAAAGTIVALLLHKKRPRADLGSHPRP